MPALLMMAVTAAAPPSLRIDGRHFVAGDRTFRPVFACRLSFWRVDGAAEGLWGAGHPVGNRMEASHGRR